MIIMKLKNKKILILKSSIGEQHISVKALYQNFKQMLINYNFFFIHKNKFIFIIFLIE